MRPRRSMQALTADMIAAHEKVTPGSVWQHYKGHSYRVVTLAYNEEDLDVVVVYEPLARRGVVFVRALTQWFDIIDKKTGTTRFTLVDDLGINGMPSQNSKRS